MEKFEKICKLGEGAYGTVYKCRIKETGQYVAIKKFIDTDDDSSIRKIAMREVRMLKMLKHPNLINLIEAFRRKKKLHLIFEYCEQTLLNEIEKNKKGYHPDATKQVLYQILQALTFCHENNVIHRDIKPENILLTIDGVIKICDFTFARTIAPNEGLTDYVATLWYRAPELLVGDIHYGPPVDVWAIGCVFAELGRGQALWPGKSDLDQLYLIKKTMGNFLPHHMEIFQENVLFQGLRIKGSASRRPLKDKMPQNFPNEGLDFLEKCLNKDPALRWTCAQLLTHEFFQGFTYHLPQQEIDKFEKLRLSSSFSTSMSLPLLTSNSTLSQESFSTMTSPEIKPHRPGLHFPNI